MTTAFQPSAFQNNAFQIDAVIAKVAANVAGAGSVSHDGSTRKLKTKKQQYIGALAKIQRDKESWHTADEILAEQASPVIQEHPTEPFSAALASLGGIAQMQREALKRDNDAIALLLLN